MQTIQSNGKRLQRFVLFQNYKQLQGVNTMAEKAPKTIQRKIFFYKVSCLIDGQETQINEIYDAYILKLNKNFQNLSDRKLAIPYYDKYHFLDIEQHEIDKNTYKGKFYSLRSTDFPYLFNMQNGIRQEISSNDFDTLMEQTHFYCFTNQRLIVSEYNYYGARIERLAEYLTIIMYDIYPSKKVEISISPIIIPEYFEEIINCTSLSKLQFKVASPGLKILAEKKIIGLTDIAKYGIEDTSDFYIDIEISGGGRGKRVGLSNVKKFMQNIVSAIKEGNSLDSLKADGEENTFRKAKVKAYNPNEGKIIPYDLLDEKLVHNCYVEKISNKTKYVDSNKMFDRIIEAYHSKKDDALKYMERL